VTTAFWPGQGSRVARLASAGTAVSLGALASGGSMVSGAPASAAPQSLAAPLVEAVGTKGPLPFGQRP
jgi:hypothetical protein